MINYETLGRLLEFAFEHQLHVTSTVGGQHNAGSLHPLGRAIDVSVKGMTDNQVHFVIAEATRAGFQVRDERVHPPGQRIWTGPHLHISLPI